MNPRGHFYDFYKIRMSPKGYFPNRSLLLKGSYRGSKKGRHRNTTEACPGLWRRRRKIAVAVAKRKRISRTFQNYGYV